MKNIIPKLFLLLLFSLFLTTSHAYEIKNCDSDAMADISAAADFIGDNLDTVVSKLTFLNEEQRQEILRKWPNIIIKCTDDSKHCRSKSTVGGYAHGGLGNTIKICYGNLLESGLGPYVVSSSICDLVEIIFHEFGHANGFPKLKKHNDATNFSRNNDLVYLLSDTAKSCCESIPLSGGGIVNSKLSGAARTALGGFCTHNTDCASGRCENNQCVCNHDTDCPGENQVCYTPVFKNNYCSTTNKSIGDSCTKNSQCATNKCEQDKCVCKKNDDCLGTRKCKKPIFGMNYCSN